MHGTRGTQAGPCCTLTTRTDSTWLIFMGRWVICQRNRKTQRRLCVWYRPAVDNYRVRLVALFLASHLHHTQNAIRHVWNSVVRPGSILEMRHFTRFLCGKKASVDLSMEYSFFIKLQCLKWAKQGNVTHWDSNGPKQCSIRYIFFFCGVKISALMQAITFFQINA